MLPLLPLLKSGVGGGEPRLPTALGEGSVCGLSLGSSREGEHGSTLRDTVEPFDLHNLERAWAIRIW